MQLSNKVTLCLWVQKKKAVVCPEDPIFALLSLSCRELLSLKQTWLYLSEWAQEALQGVEIQTNQMQTKHDTLETAQHI